MHVKNASSQNGDSPRDVKRVKLELELRKMWRLIIDQCISSHGAFVIYLHVLGHVSVDMVIILYIFWMCLIVYCF